MSRPDTYRRDLDGLRGIAIALVAIFHIWFGRVSGGVDVFLTLSGYFFVASLAKHITAGQSADVPWTTLVNPLPRLTRLVRRLLPALLTVLAAVMFLSVAILPRTRWSGVGSELVASALYYQNWHLAANAMAYSAASSMQSPLQHLWSMSVQGQFFVATLLGIFLVGALIRLTSRGRQRTEGQIRVVLFGLLAVIAVASLLYADARQQVDQAFNYYDTFARAWEPLAGGLLALFLPRVKLPAWLRLTLGVIALAVIITCGWFIDGVAEYPAFPALVPVLSTLVLIWVGAPQARGMWPGSRHQPVETGVLQRFLANRVMTWLGSISYSLYLWHWSLLIIYLAWREKDDASFVEGTGLIAVSVLFAWITTRVVEQPLRSPSAKDAASAPSVGRRIHVYGLVGALAVATVLGGVGIRLWQNHVDEIRLPESLNAQEFPGARALVDGADVPNVKPQPNPLVAGEDLPQSSLDGTMAPFQGSEPISGVYGDRTAKRTISVIGGSHSEFWLAALDTLGKRHGFKVTTYVKAACPLTVDRVTFMEGQQLECGAWTRKVLDRIYAEKPDWIYTLSTRPIEAESPRGDEVSPDYIKIFDELKAKGRKVIAVRDTPWTWGALSPSDCISAGYQPNRCGIARDLALSPTDPTLAIQKRYPNMRFVDFNDAVCGPEYCPAVVGNIIVYRDWHHLTDLYVRSMTDYIGKKLGPVTGWWQ